MTLLLGVCVEGGKLCLCCSSAFSDLLSIRVSVEQHDVLGILVCPVAYLNSNPFIYSS